MSTNWGSAQFNKAPFVNGANVRETGIVKLWHYRKTWDTVPTNTPAETPLAPTLTDNTETIIPWIPTDWDEAFYGVGGRLSFGSLWRPDQICRVTVTASGHQKGTAASVGNYSCMFESKLTLGSLMNVTQFPPPSRTRHWVNIDPATGLGLYTIPFTSTATWVFSLKPLPANNPYVHISQIVSDINKTDYGMYLSFRCRSLSGVPGLTNPLAYIREVDVTIEYLQGVDLQEKLELAYGDS